MAWTADGTRFKYSRRVGSRVVTSYFPGPFGAEVAERIAERRRLREKLKEIRAEDRIGGGAVCHRDDGDGISLCLGLSSAQRPMAGAATWKY